MGIRTKRMPTVMRSGHQFSEVPSVGINRSVFDRSHGYKTTMDGGYLIPVFLDWVLPGDTMTLKMTALIRFVNPLFKPLMDNLYLESFFFFVPDRLVWTNFVKQMGEQLNPGDTIAYTTPQYTGMPAGGFAIGTVYDYLGLPTAGTPAVVASISVSALPIRAYSRIYQEWFRDENLISSTNSPIVMTDGPDTGATFAATLVPYKRGKRHDYFTSALPFLQKGTAVSLPLGTTAPVKTAAADAGQIAITDAATGDLRWMGTAGATLLKNADAGGESNAMYADLSTAAAATINDMRQAIAIQQFLERDARGGTRYTELIFSHFRVKSPDARLQRSEYLGGGSSPILIAPITQNTQTGLTGGSTAFGSLAGQGAGVAQNHGFTKSFTEHGILMGIVNVRADLTYSQGIERHWSHLTRYDRFWPVLEELGEQSVLSKELFATGAAGDNDVFGYQERYAEYRYKPSKLTALMRPSAAGTLSVWNASELFASRPTLGQTFIEDQLENVLDTRVNVPGEPDFLFDAFFDYKCARPMRVFGVPGLRRL